MSDFLDLIESISPADASAQRLYRGEGRRARGIGNQAQYQAAFLEAVRLVRRVSEGNRYAAIEFTEAMSTSDFPLLFGDVIDRALLAAYREYPSTIEQIARVSSVRDFRPSRRFALDGAEGQLQQVNELGEYPEAAVSEARDQLTIAKFGRRLPLSWEDLVNDDLDAFRTLPSRLAKAARRTQQRFVTGLWVDANGPHASLYTAGFKNQIITANGAASNNPVLSIAGLQSGMVVLGNMVDTDGEPILIDAVTLVVGPALEITARNILNALTLRTTTAGGATNQELEVANWMKDKLNLVVDPYIKSVASSANGATTWALFANPSGEERAALEFARLRGHEEPEIWIKAPNAMRAGGGAVGPEQGDFEDDGIHYRVRTVHGGARLTNTGGARLTVASNGSGS